MTYVQILRERIAAGEITLSQALAWLVSHGMSKVKAREGLTA